jgi:60 kDa SS-A/Ro ribonucleoprotein
MANAALQSVNKRNPETPQTEKAAPGQKKNNAGGYTFVLDDMARAQRFLILGSDSSFYESGKKLSTKNADMLIRLAESEQSVDLTNLIVEISLAGRAPSQDPGLFALAIVSSYGDLEAKQYARAQLPAVARTASSLFTYISYTQQFRGWGMGLRKAVANWYLAKDLDKLAYQEIKYKAREGYTHRDVLRLSHPNTNDEGFNRLARWTLRGEVEKGLPKIVKGHIKAQKDGADLPKLIRKYGLSWEMVPTEALNRVDVWEALLEGNVPLGALLRQLPRLTKIGVIKPLGGLTTAIAARLTDEAEIKRARIHPLKFVVAQRTYAKGRNEHGSTWTPNQKIVDALDRAFYKAFIYVEPSGARIMQAIDLSASMTWQSVLDGVIDSREAATIMAMAAESVEPETYTVGFTALGHGARNADARGWGIEPLAVSSKKSLDENVRVIASKNAGATDLSMPMTYAMAEDIDVDTFVIYTDNETNVGTIHPFEALKQYRLKTGIDAQLIVVAMTATKFTIADPNDPGMLDIAGFDSAVPSLISQFAASNK